MNKRLEKVEDFMITFVGILIGIGISLALLFFISILLIKGFQFISPYPNTVRPDASIIEHPVCQECLDGPREEAWWFIPWEKQHVAICETCQSEFVMNDLDFYDQIFRQKR